MTPRASAIVLGVGAAARTIAGLMLGFRPFDDTVYEDRYADREFRLYKKKGEE